MIPRLRRLAGIGRHHRTDVRLVDPDHAAVLDAERRVVELEVRQQAKRHLDLCQRALVEQHPPRRLRHRRRARRADDREHRQRDQEEPQEYHGVDEQLTAAGHGLIVLVHLLRCDGPSKVALSCVQLRSAYPPRLEFALRAGAVRYCDVSGGTGTGPTGLERRTVKAAPPFRTLARCLLAGPIVNILSRAVMLVKPAFILAATVAGLEATTGAVMAR